MNISNALSLLRLPLACLFISTDPMVRFGAILAAAVTDYLDGFLARRWRQTSQLGATLDPLMDKAFMSVVFLAFLLEGSLTIYHIAALMCRDLAVILFGIYLHITGDWTRYQFRSIWCGKVTTCFQFFVITLLTFQVTVPSAVYSLFIVLGCLAFIELSLLARSTKRAA